MLIEITYNVTDVFMSTTETPVYVEISFEQPGGTSAVWGSITGTLSNQTDLQNALNAKLDESTIDGGAEGQILSKASATDFDFAWINNYAKYLATNVRNQTGSTIGAFQVVYISGATGNKPLISLADADTEATSSKTYGVTATSIANNSTGDVVTAGELSGIDTSAFNEGDLLWLSTTAGGVVTSPPAEPAHAVFIGYVVRSHPTLGTIDVSIQNGYELNELHGVQITTPTDNQGLFYNSTSSLWENKSIATALGFTPVPTTRTITINGVTFDLSADRTYTIAAGISGSGASGQVTYWTGSSAVSGSNNLFWDNANGRLGIGTNAPAVRTHIVYSDNTFLNGVYVQNTNTGANAYTGIGLQDSSGNVVAGFQYVPNTFSNAALRNTVLFASTGLSKLGFVANSGGVSSTPQDIFFQTLSAKNNIYLYGSTGNLVLQNGGTFSDGGQRLQVIGDTLLRGSGATSATTALTVQNSASTNLLTVRNDGYTTVQAVSSTANLQIGNFLINNITTSGITTFSMGSRNSFFEVGFAGGGYSWTFRNTSNILDTSGLINHFNLTATVAPTSGTLAFNLLNLNPTINQTGGANGITRGLYVNPTLTAAADFRAIETSAGNVLFGSNFFWDNANGRLGIGTNAPAFDLQIQKSVGSGGAVVANFKNTNSSGEAAISILNDSFYAGFELFGSLYPTAGLRNQALFTTQSGVTYLGFATLGNAPIGFRTNTISGTANERLTILGNGNVAVNSTSDLGVRFGVIGDTLLRGSGATSATTALTVQNSSSTNLFRVLNNGEINIGGGTQDYVFAKRANLLLTLQSQLTGSLQQTEYYTKDGDGTDDNGFAIFARGIPSDITNFEQFRYFYSASLTSYIIGTNKGGTGVFRDIRIGNSLTPTDLIVKADTGNILVNTTTDVASSRLTINSTTQGFLPPRMTTTQKNAISSPAVGLVVYDTTLNKLCVYTTAWETITSI